MKLLDFPTDEAADVLCTVAPLIDNIVTDKELKDILAREIKANEITRVEAAFELFDRVIVCVPIVFGAHRDDFIGIVAALNRKDADEIKAQPMRDTLSQVTEIFNDKEFADFFGSFVRRGKSASSTQSA